MEPGIYYDLSSHQYHNGKGVSSSKLKQLMTGTPLKFKWKQTYGEPESKPAYDEGSAVHCKVLEPQNWIRDFRVGGIYNLRTKDGRAGRDAEVALAKANNQILIDLEQDERTTAMANSIWQHPKARTLLRDTVNEASIYWEYQNPYKGIKQLCKVRPDALNPELQTVIDIKSTSSAAHDDFQRSVIKFQYHLSAAMYLTGVNQCKPLTEGVKDQQYKRFVLICVESDPPYQVACYELGFDWLDLGQDLFEEAIWRFQQATDYGWGGYSDDIRPLQMPAWANRIMTI